MNAIDTVISRNKSFLRSLWTGRADRHGVILNQTGHAVEAELGDFTLSTRPVADWWPWVTMNWEARLGHLAAVEDDSVPYVNLNTNTGVFAAAFGCRIQVFPGSNAAAMHCVTTAAEADALAQPCWQEVPTLARHFQMAELVRDRLGPDVPMQVPDIQSPFDVAALVWNKADLLVALAEAPESVEGLVGKCERLIGDFLDDFRRAFPQANVCHCPNTWAPADLGLWLSEDEVGAISTGMFRRFCLPSLNRLSRRFGGLGMHCCAAADHQYANFQQIDGLFALNRVYQKPGPQPAIDAFSGRQVLIPAWIGEDMLDWYLAHERPGTRYCFNLGWMPTDQARRVVDKVRRHQPAGLALAG